MRRARLHRGPLAYCATCLGVSARKAERIIKFERFGKILAAQRRDELRAQSPRQEEINPINAPNNWQVVERAGVGESSSEAIEHRSPQKRTYPQNSR